MNGKSPLIITTTTVAAQRRKRLQLLGMVAALTAAALFAPSPLATRGQVTAELYRMLFS